MTTQPIPQRRKQLAALLGVSEPYLWQCLTGRRDMNPAEAYRIERESNGELSRKLLCQKTYAGIWPELVDSAPVIGRHVDSEAVNAAMAEAAKAGLIERRKTVRRADDRARIAAELAGRAV